MKRLIIGDIHGCYAELQHLLDRAGLSAEDEIIALGDIVDRGPDSPRVLDFFQKQPRARSLMGNHERKHVRSFYGEISPARSQRITRLQLGEAAYPEAVKFMLSFSRGLELPEAILVHGFWEPGRSLAEQLDTVAVGTMSGEHHLRRSYPEPWYAGYDGEKPLIVGHHDYLQNGQPLVYQDQVFGLDTGCCTGGALTGLILAFMSVTLKINQIIGGTVLNILGVGITGYFYQTGLVTEGKLQPISLGPLAELPLIGPVIFNNPPITYTAIVLVFVVHYVLFHTTWGLRTRAVGEHPRAADTLGVNVYLIRYMNVMIGGAIAGLAGAFLTLEAVGSFERGMTNGRGFVALAVMIFGNWNPLGAWGAALLFGLASAGQTQLQFGGEINIPHQFIGMLPYLLTIIVLAGFVGRSRPPAADGVPYEKE